MPNDLNRNTAAKTKEVTVASSLKNGLLATLVVFLGLNLVYKIWTADVSLSLIIPILPSIMFFLGVPLWISWFISKEMKKLGAIKKIKHVFPFIFLILLVIFKSMFFLTMMNLS